MTMLSSQQPSREYANRPKDERYPSVQALIDASRAQKESSRERTYNAKDLRAIVDGDGDSQTVQLESPRGVAGFTHWGFSQLATFVGAPAGYLRELSPKLAADCLNEGLQSTPSGTDAVLLVQNGSIAPTVRSVTTKTYARLWDCDDKSVLQSDILNHDPKWTTPPTWSGEPAGAYMGDRDSFVIVVNGGSIVNDPSASGGSGQMYRGLMIRNSVVGLCAWTMETILFRYICGNHMLWGAMGETQYRRRHVGKDGSMTRDVVREIQRVAWNFTNQSAARDEQIIRTLIDREIASTKEGIIDELRKMGATKEQAEQAYAVAEQTESASPRSFWGVANGFTRLSQEQDYQDGRYALDQLAAKVLERGRKLVAA